MDKLILNTKYLILHTIVFLFPFFFLKTTQEYFVTNKLYFLGFGILLLLLISLIQFIFSKKITWKKSLFDGPIILFFTSVTISTFFTPNKIQSLLNLNFGAAIMFFLAILYFYVSRNVRAIHESPLWMFSIILSLITIVLYFFIPGFTPVGSQLDLVILLGFLIVWELISLPRKRQEKQAFIFTLITASINLFALGLTAYAILTKKTGFNIIQQFPPFRLSWLAVLEIFKKPITAFFGIGPDNFSTIFTKIKDFYYNQSSLWQINSFYVSRSAFFQIITETGFFGLLSFCILIFSVFKSTLKQWNNEEMKPFIYLFSYLIICLFVLPSSLIVWFLFFITIGLISQQSNNKTMKQSVNHSNNLLIHVCIILISLALIGGTGYLLGRSYIGELFYKKSIDGIIINDAKQAYENQRQATILNPFIEKYRNNFAQINIFTASNLAKKAPEKISQEERQIITQAVQMAISEGKELVKLNSKKAHYWSNLGDIYVNIIPLAKDSDIWAIASYQRAIVLDPFNPAYQLNIGGVYFRIGKYKEAIPFFEEATKLKPDWPNAHYNLAWAYFRNKDYQKALFSMKNSINLIKKDQFPKEWSTANRDFELFKSEYRKLGINP